MVAHTNDDVSSQLIFHNILCSKANAVEPKDISKEEKILQTEGISTKVIFFPRINGASFLGQKLLFMYFLFSIFKI
jgi:hypothetical protein